MRYNIIAYNTGATISPLLDCDMWESSRKDAIAWADQKIAEGSTRAIVIDYDVHGIVSKKVTGQVIYEKKNTSHD